MVFTVKNNWLYENNKAVEKVECSRPKYSSGNNICDYIIYHYTASGSVGSAHNTYKAAHTNVSWHLTIDRAGKLYQLLDFRKRAWHAGRSNWRRPDGSYTGGMNKWAIGIEMISAGPLKYTNGAWRTWYNVAVPENEVFIDKLGKGWHNFTCEQIRTAREITPVLVKRYNCIDVLGHEEVSPGRKTDPGPAFWDVLDDIRKDL